jgi:non-specific serine/threonine protein kinase
MDMLTNLGVLAFRENNLDLAETRSEEALTLGLQAGELVIQAINLHVRALIACRRGQLERAAASVRKAEELLQAAGNVLAHTNGLEVCAIVLTARGQAEGGREERAERAARLLGAAAAERERIGASRPRGVPTREDAEAAAAEARATLGEAGWAAAYAAGRALSREEAYTEALKVSLYSAVLPDVVQTVATRRK